MEKDYLSGEGQNCNYLSPLFLFVLVDFYIVPSFTIYFSVITFCITFCVCGLLSTGCRIVFPLACGVCPLVGEVGPGTCAGFLVGGTGIALHWFEWPSSKNLQAINAGEGVEKREPSYTVAGNVN